jgi:hypothetical protein
MLKRILILLTLILLFPCPVLAVGEGVVINRFQISGAAGANDEFVELKNTGLVEVNLGNWQLGKVSASGSKGNLVTAFPESRLAPGQSLVVGHPNYTGTSDLKYSSASYYLSDDSSIVLYGPKQADNTRAQIDLVGYGKSPVFETKAISAPKDAEIYSRKNNGQDTDNNEQDFYLSYAPPITDDPEVDDSEGSVPSKEETATSKSATVGAKIILTEFMPNPEGSDADGEWIEIYNTGSDANISGYIVADRVGSPKKYKLPEGTIIKSKQYLAFYSGKTPISLNNDGDAVELQSADGVVFNFTPNSGRGPEGASFALAGNGWSWTAKPTPGRANIIEAVSSDKKTGDKSGGEVLGLVDENQLPTQEDIIESQVAKNNDQLMGYGLIALAIIGGISYTLYTYKEKIHEFYYHKLRKRDHLPGSEIRRRLKGRRDISADR